MMVAYAFARSYPKLTERLILMEAPLPGTDAYQTALGDTDRRGDWGHAAGPPKAAAPVEM